MKSLGRWHQYSILAISYAVLAFLAYGASLSSAFISDDYNLIHGVSRGGPFGIFSHAPTDYFRPIVSLSIWTDYQLYGLNPIGYHVTNVLLHVAVSVLVALLFTRVFGSLRLQNPERLGMLSGGIYLLLPSHFEPVVWIAARSDLLGSIFTLLTLLSYLHYLETKRTSVLFYTALFALAAFLSQETTLPVVAIAPFFGVLVEGREAARRILGAAVLLAAIAAIFFVWRSTIVGSLVGASSNQSLLIAPKPTHVIGNVALYWFRSLLPGIPPDWLGGGSGLRMMDHLSAFIRANRLPLILISLFIVVVTAILLQRNLGGKENEGRRRLFFAALVSFALPASLSLPLFVSLTGTRNERYVYLPSVFSLLAVIALIPMLQNWRNTRSAAVLVVIFLGCIAGLCSNTLYNNRAAAFAEHVYQQLPVLSDELVRDHASTAVLINGPETLDGYAVCTNSLNSALQLLTPPGRNQKLYVLAKADFASFGDEMSAVIGRASIAGVGGFILAAGPPDISPEMQRRFDARITSLNELTWNPVDDPVVKVVYLSGGQLQSIAGSSTNSKK